jgi:sugar/nucleoside kinase (ribokinase family)
MTTKKIPSDPSIFGIGLVALDLLLTDGATELAASAGGTCGNILIILAALGWQAYPIARLDNDPAGHVVIDDLKQWGAKVDYSQLQPLAPTPIIVEHLKSDKNGLTVHSFSRKCPSCDQYLPGYQAVTAKSLDSITQILDNPTVIFVDRASKSALKLVERASEWGAIVFFEPSSGMNPQFFERILHLTHILKYSKDRFADFSSYSKSPNLLLEIQTLGQAGLQFRDWFSGSNNSEWRHLRAVPNRNFVDACGAGDWFTSGVIFSLCNAGFSRLTKTTDAKLLSSLSLAQRLASWSCGFPGARGGMYALEGDQLSDELRRLIKANDVTMPSKKTRSDSGKSHTHECLGWTPLRRKQEQESTRSAG